MTYRRTDRERPRHRKKDKEKERDIVRSIHIYDEYNE